MSLQHILDTATSFRSIPVTDLLAMLETGVKGTSDGNLNGIFFSHASNSSTWGGVNHAGHVADIAIPLMGWNVGQVSSHSFNRCINISKSLSTWTSAIMSSNGLSLSRDIFKQWLINNKEMQTYFSNAAYWGTTLANKLTDPRYIVPLLVNLAESENQLVVFIKLLFVRMLNESEYHKVVQVWRNHMSSSFLLKAENFVQHENFLQAAVPHYKSGALGGPANSACNVTVKTSDTITYGHNVASWLTSSSGPRRYGIISGSSPDNVTHIKKSSGGGCFVSGTPILTEDGSWVKIEELTEDDVIVGSHGSLALISNERVEFECDEETHVFTLNESELLFTNEHPFWTHDGWRALNPYKAKEENPWLEVGLLRHGDSVLKLQGYSREIQQCIYEWEEIRNIGTRLLPRGSIVHGLHVREGCRSYHAAGYLVHINYPEITGVRLHSGITINYQDGAIPCVTRTLEPHLTSAAGPSALGFLQGLHFKKTLNIPKAQSGHLKSSLPLEEVFSMDMNISYWDQVNEGAWPTRISVVRGRLFVDGELVPDADMVNKTKHVWQRMRSDGWLERGELHHYPDRMSGHGVLTKTKDSRYQQKARFHYHVQTNEYVTRVSIIPIHHLSNEADPETKNIGPLITNFGNLKIGYKVKSGVLTPSVRLDLSDSNILQEETDMHDHHLFHVDENNRLNLEINVPNEYKPIVRICKMVAVFDWDLQSFQGHVISYDPAKPHGESEKHLWTGMFKIEAGQHDMISQANRHALKSAPAHQLLSKAFKHKKMMQNPSSTVVEENNEDFEVIPKEEIDADIKCPIEVQKSEPQPRCLVTDPSRASSTCCHTTVSQPESPVTPTVPTTWAKPMTMSADQYLTKSNTPDIVAVPSQSFGSLQARTAQMAPMSQSFASLKATTAQTAPIKHPFPSLQKTNVELDQISQSFASLQTKIVGSDQISQSFASFQTSTFKAAVNSPGMETDNMMSLEDLITSPPVDQKEMHTLTFNYIKQAMETKIPNNWRENLLGITSPSIKPEIQALADKHHTFLVKNFGTSYLTYGMSQSSTLSKKFSDEEKNKLLYYWAGDGTTSLSKSRDYSLMNSDVSTQAFLDLSPTLRKYYNSSDRTSWAKKLYENRTQSSVILGLVVSSNAQQSMSIMQKQCMMLQVLQSPEDNYGALLYQKFLDFRLHYISESYKGSESIQEAMNNFIFNCIKHFVNLILANDPSVYKQLRDQLQKLIKESQIELKTENIQDFFDRISPEVNEMVNLWVKDVGSQVQKLSNATTKWFANNSTLSKTGAFLSNVMGVAMCGYAVYATVELFMNWKDLNDRQKVSAVISAVNVGAQMFAKIPNVVETFSSIKKGFFSFELVKNWMSARQDPAVTQAVEDSIHEDIASVEEVPVEQVPEEMAGAVAESTASAEEELATVSKWETFCNVTKSVARVTNVIALGASAVAVGFQIARDFSSGAPVGIKVFDITQAVVIGLQITLELVSGVLDILALELACVPVLGAVLAIAGIIMAIVSLFLKRSPPKPKPTPAESFISDHGKPYIATLNKPTQKWLNDYHSHHTKDKKAK